MADTLFGELAREIARYRNRHFLKAAMAAAALVAAADGVVRLTVRHGAVALGSLACPGFAVAAEPDWAGMRVMPEPD